MSPDIDSLRMPMTSQPIEARSQQLEARVATLEAELAQLKQLLVDMLPAKAPWWTKVAGSFAADPTFDASVRAGQEWRKSAE